MSKDVMMLYGKKSVLQRLRRNPGSIRKIFLDDIFDDAYILTIVTRRKIPIIRLTRNKFLRVKHADRLQGIIAEVDKFVYTELEDLLNADPLNKPSLLFLDSLNDPHNLGSIMRTAACFGNFALVIPRHGSCEINDTVMHVSTGGENYVPVAMVSNLATALIDVKKAGYWVAGTVVEGGEDLNKVTLPSPVCLILGSEGKGIREGLQKQIDVKVTLPMPGAKLSFNVAMAAAIFCYEITKQKIK